MAGGHPRPTFSPCPSADGNGPKMKWPALMASLGLAAVLTARVTEAQSLLDCSCLSTQAVLFTNACCGVIPDLCPAANNCYSTTVVPPPGFTCTQNPPPGTPVCSSTLISFTLIQGRKAAHAASVENPIGIFTFVLRGDFFCAARSSAEADRRVRINRSHAVRQDGFLLYQGLRVNCSE